MGIHRILSKNNILFCWIVYVAVIFTYSFLKNKLSIYVFNEWLIHYDQGFIRRGLPGTLLLILHREFGLDIYSVVMTIGYVLLFAFFVAYLYKVKKAIDFLSIESLLVVLFLPSLVLFPMNTAGMVGRKDFFFFLGFLINLYLVGKFVKDLRFAIKSQHLQEKEYRRNTRNLINRYCLQLFIWYNLTSIPVALSHEAIIFLAIPINIMITLNLLGLFFTRKQAIIQSLVIFMPTIFVSILFITFFKEHDIDTLVTMCQSWQEYMKDSCDESLPKAFIWLSRSTLYVIGRNFQFNFKRLNGLAFPIWISMFLLNIFILTRISFQTIKKVIKKYGSKDFVKLSQGYVVPIDPVNILTSFIVKYFFIPMLFSLILYVIALDWGRWFFLISTLYIFCLMTPSLIYIELCSNSQQSWISQSLGIAQPICLRASRKIQIWGRSKYYMTLYFSLVIYACFVMEIPAYKLTFQSLHDNPVFKYTVKKTIEFLLDRLQ